MLHNDVGDHVFFTAIDENWSLNVKIFHTKVVHWLEDLFIQAGSSSMSGTALFVCAPE